MYKYMVVSIILILFSFSSCALKADRDNRVAKHKYIIGKKSFEQEDELILKGLYLAQKRDFEEATKTFEELYDKSGKEIYIIEALKLIYHSGKFNNSEDTDRIIKKSLTLMDKDYEIKRMVAVFFLYQDKVKESEKLALSLIKKEKSVQNYNLLALIYKHQENYEKAYEYFINGYNIDFNDDSIKQSFDIKYNYLDEKKEAKVLLETHVRMKGCSKDICLFLGKIYRLENDFESMADIYNRLYNKFKKKQYLEYLIDIYIYLRKYDEAIELLKKSKDYEKLMKIYAVKSDFVNASNMAAKIYKKNRDIEFLALESIYMYEHLRKIKSFKGVKQILNKFKIVVQNTDKAEYFNYYGYLLIDHDIDIKEGMLYVKKALEKKPDYDTYLDSLAWGYYKLGQCKEALEIMEKIITHSDDEEIIKHYNIIKKCKKNKGE